MSESNTSVGTTPPAESSPNDHLKREPFEEDLRSTYAKIRGMGFLDTQAVFTRDSKRLDARNKAVYAKLGLKTEEAPGELHMIADNIQLDDAARSEIFKHLDDKEMGDVRIVADNITFMPGANTRNGQTAPAGPGVSTPAVSTPAEAQPAQGGWLKPAVAALAAAVLGAGVAAPVAYYLRTTTPAVDTDTDTNTDTNTRGVLELVPESGQSIR